MANERKEVHKRIGAGFNKSCPFATLRLSLHVLHPKGLISRTVTTVSLLTRLVGFANHVQPRTC